jgi:hypothetical protein
MKLPAFFALSASLLLGWNVPAAPARAHGGGLNAQGCHTNHKTGDYHCHRGASSPASPHTNRTVSSGRAFSNCSEARAAGAAPVHVGDPGYGPHLDRDHDGVGCE